MDLDSFWDAFGFLPTCYVLVAGLPNMVLIEWKLMQKEVIRSAKESIIKLDAAEYEEISCAPISMWDIKGVV